MDLAHCHVVPDMRPSGSVSVAVSLIPSCGCNVDRVTTPSSFTLVTRTVTAREAVFPALSVATTVTSYLLFPPASVGAS